MRRSNKVILPGEAKPGLTVLVPRGYESETPPEPVAVCRIPVGPEGELCGQPFYAHEHNWERKWREHMRECVERNRDAIHAQSPRTKLPMFDEANWDPEVAAHMKKVGERMIREGRMEVHKSERAGF